MRICRIERQLAQVLLAALGLVVVPLVRRLGLLDCRFILPKQRVVLGRARHVTEERADRREDRGHDSDAPSERIARVSGMLDLVIMRTVNVKMVF